MVVKKLVLSLVTAFIVSVSAIAAEDIELNPQHPERYVVVKGDTLWDISAKFLTDPWLWSEIWYVNPQIENPHLIYPGDIINLVYIDGQPRLTLERGSRTYKLSPSARELSLDQAITTIPVDAIQQFLTRPQVVEKETLDNAPYLLIGDEQRIITATNDKIYARGNFTEGVSRYSIVRQGEKYIDPDTGDTLGYEAMYIGTADITRDGDPKTLVVKNVTREARPGDRLLPYDDKDKLSNFMPRSPRNEVDGKIIAVFDGVARIGQYQIVALNRGTDHNLKPGHVLAVYQVGATIEDKFADEDDETIKLPNERAGELMVFRTYERISYGLIMRATRTMHVHDIVTNP